MIPRSGFGDVISVFGWAVFLSFDVKAVSAFHINGPLSHQIGGIRQEMTITHSVSNRNSFSVKYAPVPLSTKHRQRQSCFVPKMSSGEKIADLVGTYQVKILRSIDEISEDEWNACALDSAGEGKENPFVLWAFFKALEDSKSAVGNVGWAPSHLSVRLRRYFPHCSLRARFDFLLPLYQERIGSAHRRRAAIPQVTFLWRIRLCAPSSPSFLCFSTRGASALRVR
jgi:hypothetical protein